MGNNKMRSDRDVSLNIEELQKLSEEERFAVAASLSEQEKQRREAVFHAVLATIKSTI
eukprot:TRINITY_DN1141_c0_g1_i1.p2 TRINITY_DN1141_c0_g1~~TRINITY_DN1141_c0_g1_i1.p2  ORF type:complete len:58 (-),score=4.96 TRINITY_DN1141_c0_g1_i1:281-454(-)